MERLVDAGISFTLLTIQYRMHPDICHIVSKLSYDGQLETGDIVREMNPAVCWIDHSCKEVPRGSSYINTGEAKEVVQAFQKESSRFSHTLVITFYKPQVNVLREAFSVIKGRRPRVITVDSAQGTEAEIVILSCVRCNNQGNVGFVKDLRRLNVAISRARQKLIIVGNLDTMRSDPNWYLVVSEARRLSGLPPLSDRRNRKQQPKPASLPACASNNSKEMLSIVSGGYADEKPGRDDRISETYRMSCNDRTKHSATIETIQLYFSTIDDRKTNRVQFKHPFKSAPEVLVRVLTKGLWVKVMSVGKGFFVYRACLSSEGSKKPGKYTFQYKAELGKVSRN